MWPRGEIPFKVEKEEGPLKAGTREGYIQRDTTNTEGVLISAKKKEAKSCRQQMASITA